MNLRHAAVLLGALVIVGCGGSSAPATPSSSSAAGAGKHGTAPERELDWLEMLPADELDALQNGDGPEVDHDGERQMPQFGTFRTVDSVLDTPVRLPGYVVPLGTAQDGRLTEFLFVPYYGACIHVPPPPPNQIVHVVLASPIAMPDMYSPFFLAGTLRAERVNDALAGSAYTMQHPELRPYEP